MQELVEFTHDLHHKIESISGWYELEKEGTLEINGRVILYVVGNACIDSSCCGVGGCRYALVPGYVHRLKVKRNDHGKWISEVHPVQDGKTRKTITSILRDREMVQQVSFG